MSRRGFNPQGERELTQPALSAKVPKQVTEGAPLWGLVTG
jgi:hypothetical protein